MSVYELPIVSRVSRSSDFDVAHGEDGAIEPAADFDYESVFRKDEDVFHVEPQSNGESLSPEALDAARKVIVRVMEWIWSDGTKNIDGLQNRAATACWKFLPQLRPLTMTQMAKGFGKHKQSLGRAVDSFNLAFPELAGDGKAKAVSVNGA